MNKHVGIIRIDYKVLLSWLQYDGGRIHSIQQSPYLLDQLELMVEHPDMPVVKEGEQVLIIIPTYRTQDTKRIEPPVGIRSKMLRFWNLVKTKISGGRDNNGNKIT